MNVYAASFFSIFQLTVITSDTGMSMSERDKVKKKKKKKKQKQSEN